MLSRQAYGCFLNYFWQKIFIAGTHLYAIASVNPGPVQFPASTVLPFVRHKQCLTNAKLLLPLTRPKINTCLPILGKLLHHAGIFNRKHNKEALMFLSLTG